jgi:hypothetical protein
MPKKLLPSLRRGTDFALQLYTIGSQWGQLHFVASLADPFS